MFINNLFRSNKSGPNGKWWQVMRANYIRNVYLPEHQPLPQTYKSISSQEFHPIVIQKESVIVEDFS